MEQILPRPRGQSGQVRSRLILLFHRTRGAHQLCELNSAFFERPEAHFDWPNCHRPGFYLRPRTVASVHPFRGYHFLRGPDYTDHLDNATAAQPGQVVPDEHQTGGPIPPGIGKLTQCRLSGKRRLRRQSTHQYILNMLMEVPTGPQFVEVEIRDARMDCFPATLTLTNFHFSTLVLGISSLPLACEIRSLNSPRATWSQPILRLL